MSARWSDSFSELSRRKVGASRSKTTQADEVLWQGTFEGQMLCVVSTVRLINGNLAHFCCNSGARIGSNAWNLRGGHYVDLRVLTRRQLSPDALRRLGELARTEEQRPVALRQGTERLDQAIAVPMPS